MKQLFALYLLPVALINFGNVFAYLFQLLLARSLTVADVGAFNALFSLVNFIAAPASIVPFVIARAMILTIETNGATRTIIERSALGGLAFAAIIVAIGMTLVGPLCTALNIERTQTALLALALLATTLLYTIAIGWLQGSNRYIAAALALAGVPVLRFVSGLWLVVALAGGLDAAMAATGLPGLIVFVAGIAAMHTAFRTPRGTVPPAVWYDLGRFTLSASISAFLLLGFWNLDMVLVRALFTPDESGFYAVAAVLGRIPFLLSVALVNVLFPEATRIGLMGNDAKRAGRRVLLLNLGFAAGFGLTAALVLSLAAEPLLILFAGAHYTPAASLLRMLCFTMAAVALVQVVATYLMAQNRHGVLWLLAAALACFLGLSGAFADSPLWVARCLAVTVVILLAACLAFAWLSPVGMTKTERPLVQPQLPQARPPSAL